MQGDSAYIKGAKPMFAVVPRANGTEASPAFIWTGTFKFNNQTFFTWSAPIRRLDRRPSPLVIIPLKFKFTDGTTLSAAQTVCGDVKNTNFRVKNSPLIKKGNTFTPGGTNVGKTQYVDAYQRANFWNFVSTTAPNYHVLLSPVQMKPVQTINVGTHGTTVSGPCARIGGVDINFFSTTSPWAF
jgi:hypothetical protein